MDLLLNLTETSENWGRLQVTVEFSGCSLIVGKMYSFLDHIVIQMILKMYISKVPTLSTNVSHLK